MLQCLLHPPDFCIYREAVLLLSLTQTRINSETRSNQTRSHTDLLELPRTKKSVNLSSILSSVEQKGVHFRLTLHCPKYGYPVEFAMLLDRPKHTKTRYPPPYSLCSEICPGCKNCSQKQNPPAKDLLPN